MAEKKATQEVAATSKAAAPQYTVDEIAEAAGVFGATPDLVRAAFAVAGKTAATEREAKNIIHKFKEAKK